jgi:hypothetical protein
MASQPTSASVQFEDKLREYCRYLGPSTVIFVWPTDEGAPHIGGTGVLLYIPPSFFFALTAGHVGKQVANYTREGKAAFICGAGEVEQAPILIDKVSLISSHLGVQDGHIDVLDTAAIKLSSPIVERLVVHNRFLTLNDLDLSVETDGECCYYVLGYAIRGQPLPDFERMLITREPFHFCTYLAKEQARELVVYDEEVGVAIGYGPQIRQGMNGQLQNTIDLNGISGCGIWRLGPTSRSFVGWQPEEAKLVALEHKVVTNPSVIVGTQIKCILQLILNTNPEVKDAIRAAFRLP